MKLTNEALGHALLRIGLGLDFLAHGLARIGGLSAFAESMKGMFAKILFGYHIVVSWQVGNRTRSEEAVQPIP